MDRVRNVDADAIAHAAAPDLRDYPESELHRSNIAPKPPRCMRCSEHGFGGLKVMATSAIEARARLVRVGDIAGAVKRCA
jgi:hypothetical protein